MNKNKNELAIVVLFWNNSDKTIACLKSLFSQKKQKFNIILVDNNSDLKYRKNIINWLKKNKKKTFLIDNNNKKFYFKNKICFYIKNKQNYGCGLGHNPGYKFCLDHNFKFVARIDNDMILPNLIIANLMKRLKKNKKILSISPKIMFYKKPDYVWWRGIKIGNKLKLQKNFASFNTTKGQLDSKKFKGLISTDAIAGCASIMRSERLKQSGFSDPDFFYGEEDVELSFRLKKNKDSLKVDLNEKIFHDISSTVGTNWGKNVYYNYKYRLLLVKKIGTKFDKFFGYAAAIIKFLLSILLIYDLKHSSRVLQKYFALKHFFQNKLGKFDRDNYYFVNNFFSKVNKKTTCTEVIKLTFLKKKINF